MKNFISTFIFFVIGITLVYGQKKYTIKDLYLNNDETKRIVVKFKMVSNKEKKKELRVKFINKSKTTIDLKTEFGLYDNGVLEETSEITLCMKKSFFDNWFRPIRIIESDLLQNNDIETSITEYKISQIDECGKTSK